MIKKILIMEMLYFITQISLNLLIAILIVIDMIRMKCLQILFIFN